ncbi:MAG: hypothetical protein ABIS92_18275 [Polyangia bacterium]
MPGAPRLLLLAAIGLSWNCKPQPSTSSNDVRELKARIARLEQKVHELDLDAVNLRIQQKYGPAATLRAQGLNRYQRIETPSGAFLVLLKKFERVPIGYSVLIEIGNPQFITFPDANVRISWGGTDSNLSAWSDDAFVELMETDVFSVSAPASATDAHRAELLDAGSVLTPDGSSATNSRRSEAESAPRSQEMTLNLLPGHWSRIEAIIPARDEKSVGVISVSIKTKRVSLER